MECWRGRRNHHIALAGVIDHIDGHGRVVVESRPHREFHSQSRWTRNHDADAIGESGAAVMAVNSGQRSRRNVVFQALAEGNEHIHSDLRCCRATFRSTFGVSVTCRDHHRERNGCLDCTFIFRPFYSGKQPDWGKLQGWLRSTVCQRHWAGVAPRDTGALFQFPMMLMMRKLARHFYPDAVCYDSTTPKAVMNGRPPPFGFRYWNSLKAMPM